MLQCSPQNTLCAAPKISDSCFSWSAEAPRQTSETLRVTKRGSSPSELHSQLGLHMPWQLQILLSSSTAEVAPEQWFCWGEDEGQMCQRDHFWSVGQKRTVGSSGRCVRISDGRTLFPMDLLPLHVTFPLCRTVQKLHYQWFIPVTTVPLWAIQAVSGNFSSSNRTVSPSK